MKLAQRDAEIMADRISDGVPVVDNPYKHVERLARLCRKSEDSMTKDSWKRMIPMLIHDEHFPMLEHGTVTFALTENQLDFHAFNPKNDAIAVPALANMQGIVFTRPKGGKHCLLSLSLSHLYNPEYSDFFQCLKPSVEYYYGYNRDYDEIPNMCGMIQSPTLMPAQHRYYTVLFTTDRGVSHEAVRHRCAVSEVSTRCCNYSKEKFGCEITCTMSEMWDDENIPIEIVEDSFRRDEETYMLLTENGVSAERARIVLPHGLRTQVALTMTVPRWKHFFNLRYEGTTGKPHPDMKLVAELAYQKLSPYFVGIADDT